MCGLSASTVVLLCSIKLNSDEWGFEVVTAGEGKELIGGASDRLGHRDE